MATICPKCGEHDTLEQKVELFPEAVRKVSVRPQSGGVAVDFDKPRHEDSKVILIEHDIECTACRETWDGKKDLVEGRPREYGCDSCDWWGANEFQHGIERPDCKGALGTRA